VRGTTEETELDSLRFEISTSLSSRCGPKCVISDLWRNFDAARPSLPSIHMRQCDHQRLKSETTLVGRDKFLLPKLVKFLTDSDVTACVGSVTKCVKHSFLPTSLPRSTLCMRVQDRPPPKLLNGAWGSSSWWALLTRLRLFLTDQSNYQIDRWSGKCNVTVAFATCQKTDGRHLSTSIPLHGKRPHSPKSRPRHGDKNGWWCNDKLMMVVILKSNFSCDGRKIVDIIDMDRTWMLCEEWTLCMNGAFLLKVITASDGQLSEYLEFCSASLRLCENV
jgi:hypothetical protein